MSETNKALEELENINAEPQVLPKKKKSIIPGFSALTYEGKRRLIILSLIVAGMGYFIFGSIFKEAPSQVLIEETTGEAFTSVAIQRQGGSQLSQSTNEQELIAQARNADSKEAQFGIDQDFSGLQNVEFGNWLTVKTESPSSPFQPPLPTRVSDDGMFQQSSQRQSQVQNVERITQNINQQLARSNSLARTPNQITQVNVSQGQGAFPSQQISSTSASASRNEPDGEVKESVESPTAGLRHILPGDTLVCQLVKAIDTDVSRETYCVIHGTALDGGRITLTVTREDAYVYLRGTNLVFQNKFVPLQGAIAVDTGDVAANGLRDRVDYRRLMRFSALMLAGAGNAVTDLVGQPRTRTTTTATTTTVETIKASESDIIKAALARPAQIATENLMDVYRTPPTVYLDKDKIIHVYFAAPVTAPWMPDLRQTNSNAFKYRLY